ncbi:lactoylglutathione lyase [Clostridium butyricum]|nr:lactoylglutathione lyase [Clostridium butyricum]
MATRMLHTCIRVMDLEKSLEFYKNALGLVETRRKDFPEHKFTLVYLSDTPDGYEIELTYNYDPEKPYDLGNGFSFKDRKYFELINTKNVSNYGII